MQYMLLIYSDERSWESASDDERQAMNREYRQLSGDLREQG
jgi:hypothetical protein